MGLNANIRDSRWIWFISAIPAGLFFLFLAVFVARMLPCSGLRILMGIDWLTLCLSFAVGTVPLSLIYIGLLPLHYRQGSYPERILRLAVVLAYIPMVLVHLISFDAELTKELPETLQEFSQAAYSTFILKHQ